MKHNAKDVRVRGVVYRKCKRCKLMWLPGLESGYMAMKCPGRP